MRASNVPRMKMPDASPASLIDALSVLIASDAMMTMSI